MTENRLTEDLLHIFDEEHRIYIIYGRRECGRTTLLLQIMAELTKQNAESSYLSLTGRTRDKKVLKRINDTYQKDIEKVKVKLCEEQQPIKGRMKFMSHVIYDIFRGATELPSVYINELLPVTLISKKLSKLAKTIPLLFVFLAKCASKSTRVVMTVPENAQLLPFYWQTLIEFEPMFLRLRRARRLHDLFRVNLGNLPNTGETWDPEQVEIQAEHILPLRLSSDGLFTVLEEANTP